MSVTCLTAIIQTSHQVILHGDMIPFLLRVIVLRTCKKTPTYVFPRDAAERDLASTGESVVVLLSVWLDIKTWWQR
ncbi:hypothetical protein LAZ67_7002523 [Cordylochernes scorpioides]|uniref:Uncharacterized protein n=1 Tax=Cordylochernes scorpioides TaxID=51811 RepID=A0ABY6KRW3_9ARAC|nr:hypothetical protein LAZ67_7002523 [Cordylochernes scorpioides]